MLKLQIETIKAFNSIQKINLLNKGSLKNNFKLKSVAMPTILLSSYFFLHAKKQFSSKLNMAVEAQKSRRLSIDECKDLLDGEMRQVKYGNKDDDSILVVKYEGKLRALSNHCPHFGAPLHTGMLIDNVVKCPWHGASFDILTGTTDISPALDNLPIYEVLKDDLGFYINLPENVQKQVKPKMCKRDPNDKRRFIIIGGGPAALSAAETLRQSGFTGEITILSKESYIPYDRTMLSKFIPGAVEKLYLRSTDFLKEFDIDIYNNVIVSDVDNNKKIVKLQDGQEHSYDKLLIAAGGSPIVPNVPGKNNSNVHILRTFDDIQRIKNSCVDAKNIVIIGASFIGMESASSLKKAFPNATVTVVDKSITPFFATLGKEVGKALQKLSEDNGIKFVFEKGLTEIKSDSIVLEDNTTVQADVVLLGTGIIPNSQFLGDKLAKEKSFIKTDKYLNTSDENIFAAGDVASVPYFLTGEPVAFGHFVSAQQQGSVAALNMLDKKVTYDYVPFFWSRMWDKAIQYTGFGSSWDEVFVDGNLEELKFVAYYIKNNQIVGFASMNTPNAANIMYEGFRNNKLPRATLIKDGTANLDTIKLSLKNTKVRCKRAECLCEKRRANKQV